MKGSIPIYLRFAILGALLAICLAQLAPQLKLLVPAYNVPVAPPDALLRLDAAGKKVQAGSAKFMVTDGHREYAFEGFSLLLSEK